VESDDGRIQIRGCSFVTGEPSIHLKEGVKHAIVTENNGAYGVRIINDIGRGPSLQTTNSPRSHEESGGVGGFPGNLGSTPASVRRGDICNLLPEKV